MLIGKLQFDSLRTNGRHLKYTKDARRECGNGPVRKKKTERTNWWSLELEKGMKKAWRLHNITEHTVDIEQIITN